MVLTAGAFLLEDTFLWRRGSSISGSRGLYVARGGVHFDLEEGINIIWS